MDRERDNEGEKNPQRGAIRVETSFSTGYTAVEGKELERLNEEIKSHRTCDRLGLPDSSSSLPSDLDNIKDFQDASPAMMKMWVSIDNKLDAIMKLIGGVELKLEDAVPAVARDLSSTGMKLNAEEEIATGTHIMIRLTPPAHPSFTVDVVGKVLSSQDVEGEGYLHSIEFTAIHPDDRESLITYIFKRQREILRSKREE